MNDFKNPIDALKKWSAENDKEWLMATIDKVLDSKRELTQDEVISIYYIFLKENDLKRDKQENNPKKDNGEGINIVGDSNREAKGDQGIQKIILKSLSEIEKVNALVQGQEILFHPGLTIIYGHNATGKSGYVRILKRASKSRTSEDIWGNVHTGKEKNIGKAKFIVNIDGTEKEILWNGESEVSPLVLIDVFDNKCVKVFLTDELAFGFRPYGFELFPIISIAINQMKELLQQDIIQRKKEIDFSIHFNEGTPIFKMIKELSAATKIGALETSAQITDKDLAELKTKVTEKNNLLTANISDKIKLITSEKTMLEKLKNILTAINDQLSNVKLQEHIGLIKKYLVAKKKVEDKQTTDLTEFKIPLQGTKEWNDFIRSAEEYIKKLPDSDKYPSANRECIYCRQKLTETAVLLIKRYRSLLESQEEGILRGYENEADRLIRALNNKSFSLNNIPDLENILDGAENNLHSQVKSYCDKAENLRNALIDALTKKVETKNPFQINNIFADKITNLMTKKEGSINELRKGEAERNTKISVLDREIKELTDRKTLSEKKKQIVEYLDDLKWVKAAEGLYRLTTTKPVTDLSKKVWENVVTDEFRHAFDEERKQLKAPSIEFVFPGEQGVQKRCKSLAGMKNIDDFLSEGEQKAIALADFLAELGLKQINAPVVFDDPVTSFDHLRRKTIAERLFEESNRRQVIIFTHDILFLSYLFECCKDNEGAVFIHWVEQSRDGLFGKVNLNDCPLLDKYAMRIKKVEESIQKTKSLTGSVKEEEIMKGFSYLRGAYESFVIEKIFKKTIQRWNERIQMHQLKNIVYDNQLMAKVQDKFEELSRYIEAHTHSDSIRQDAPDENRLVQELEHLKKIEQELKDKQKNKSH
ncbi:MAG: hypothetical protein KAS99_02880 [Candidatus Omnitrophica bacterium]|nr:hypothetical protein [Candidatus Omnitrophota bacterium]